MDLQEYKYVDIVVDKNVVTNYQGINLVFDGCIDNQFLNIECAIKKADENGWKNWLNALNNWKNGEIETA